MKAIILIISVVLVLPGILDAQYTGGTGNSHSSFAIYGQSLPTNLSSFTSDVEGHIARLKWVTTIELNNYGFDIERKTKEENFVKVGYVQGKGTVNSTSSYIFEDKNLQIGKYFYRLKQIDNNGNFKYYNLNNSVDILNPIKFILSQNFPNPFNPSTFISYQLPFDSYIILKVYDIRGSEVATLINNKQSMGYYTVEFNANNFASGIYFYRIIANSNGNSFSFTKKMIIIK